MAYDMRVALLASLLLGSPLLDLWAETAVERSVCLGGLAAEECGSGC